MNVKRILASFILVCSVIISMEPAEAIGKYKWTSTSATGGWFSNGIFCWEKASDVKEGQKFTYSYKLGQSKKFIKLGSGVSVSGDTQVDEKGNIPTDTTSTLAQQDETVEETEDTSNLSNACDDGAKSVAYISPHTPGKGGALILRIIVFNKNGTEAWSTEMKLLAAYTGIESGSSFFTNPPNLFFTSETYAYLSPSNGVKGYTSKGNKRNACLLIYDIAVKGARTDGSITANDLIGSAQGGFFGANVRSIIGNGAVPTAVKCAPWVATCLW